MPPTQAALSKTEKTDRTRLLVQKNNNLI